MQKHAEHSEDAGRQIGLLKTVHTDLGIFGNRTDLIELGLPQGGASLVECDDPNVLWFDSNSPAPAGP